MPTFGRLTNSLLAANNENTLALANLNFDFMLIKFEAPKEFHPFGQSLSVQRRSEAEEGTTHKIARRLGALFEGLVPQTPELIKAYGRRTSEIATKPHINPRGTKRDGPFEAYVGADGTSLWAAVTSINNDTTSHPPLAVHLLACILARAYEAKIAVAIWVELVRARREEIESCIDRAPQPLSACMAAGQDISRDQLALWDDSARSWLRSADEANKANRTRLQLLVNNMHLTFTHHKTTYQSVISIWQNAMQGMEQAIKGNPQAVSDGSVLMALSAWHIYPNLIVLGLGYTKTETIHFNDPLVPGRGALTIGLEFTPGSRPAGVHWSLVLSHLHYYGSGVEVNSWTEIERMTIQQLLVLVYGNLMSSWGVARDGAEEKACAKWMVALRDRMIEQTTGLYDSATWYQCFSALILAASAYLRLEAEDKRTCSMIMSWGRRRCEKFMSNSSQSPFLGLNCASTMTMLDSATPLEAGIKYLRGIAQDMGLGPGDAVIRYKSWLRRSEVVQLATAIPHHRASSKRTAMNEQKLENVHLRWLWCRPRQRADIDRCTMEGCQTYDAVPVAQAKALPTLPEEEIVLLSPETTEITMLSSMALRNLDESGQKQYCVWMNPPSLYHNHVHPYQPISRCPTLSHGHLHCHCADPCLERSQYYHGAAFRLILGNMDGLGLFVRTQVETHDHEANLKLWYDRAVETLEKRSRSRTYTAGLPDNVTTVPRLLSSYINCIMDDMRDKIGDLAPRLAASKPFDIGDFVKLIGVSRLTSGYRTSLRAIRYVDLIYQNLQGATIPLNVLDISLKEVKWLDYHDIVYDSGDPTDFERFLSMRKMEIDNGFFSRAARFACIAMFESGIHNLDPSVFNPVVAMASANSLFVAAELVADPSESCGQAIKRVIGNVGRAGISLLVLPQLEPRVKELGYDWRAVPHVDYDFEREDNFQHTNLVLSFTEWSRPVHSPQRGSIGEDIFLIECVLSVHDWGKWVADIDPKNHNIINWDVSCTCPKQDEPTLTAIDSWEELLDAPDNVAVFRANGNIYARLGAVAIRKSQGTDQQKRTLIVPPGVKPCFRCVGHLDKAVIID